MNVGVKCPQAAYVLLSAKRHLRFLRQLLGILNGPLRQESGMNQHPLGFTMEQGLLSEPGEEVIAIRAFQDLRKRITSSKHGHPCGD
jgi:hypothetical protein